MIGTSDYMSPEQLLGGECRDVSDVYAVGVVLYEMLVGHRQFAAAGYFHAVAVSRLGNEVVANTLQLALLLFKQPDPLGSSRRCQCSQIMLQLAHAQHAASLAHLLHCPNPSVSSASDSSNLTQSVGPCFRNDNMSGRRTIDPSM